MVPTARALSQKSSKILVLVISTIEESYSLITSLRRFRNSTKSAASSVRVPVTIQSAPACAAILA